MAFGYATQRAARVPRSRGGNIPRPPADMRPVNQPPPSRPVPGNDNIPQKRAHFPRPRGTLARALWYGVAKGVIRTAAKGIPVIGWGLAAYDAYLFIEWLTRTKQEEGHKAVSKGWTFIKRNNASWAQPDGDKFYLSGHYQPFHDNWYNVGLNTHQPYASLNITDSNHDLIQASEIYISQWTQRRRLSVLWHKDAGQQVDEYNYPYVQPVPEIAPMIYPVTPQELPDAVPGIDPGSLPVSVPGSYPGPNIRPIPVPAVRKIGRPLREHDNPYRRDPISEPKPQPEPNPLPFHVRRPPGRKTKERKKHYAQGLSSGVRRALNAATETLDFVNCAYDALPSDIKYKGRENQNYRMKMVYQHWDKVDIDSFVKCLVANHIEDYVLGKFGQASAKASKKAGWFTGIQTGPLH